jgi:lipoprotein-releasing system ATP-binding protein
MNNSILQATAVRKYYNDGVGQVNVLNDLNFSITAGEQVAIIGPSGSGKSTLLHLLGGLEKPTAGEVSVMGENIWHCSEKKRCQLRNRALGFIYQFHHLLPEFTALENTAMPLLLANHSIKDVRERAKNLLEKAGLAHRLQHKPAQLSGGERQRVAIVRALVSNPSCILADEPTGNLDQKTAEMIYELLLDLNRSFKTSLIIVTHDEKLAARMDKVFCLSEGKLQS